MQPEGNALDWNAQVRRHARMNLGAAGTHTAEALVLMLALKEHGMEPDNKEQHKALETLALHLATAEHRGRDRQRKDYEDLPF